MSKRDKRPRRLAWYALDVDAFNDDPRMRVFTLRERGTWSLMLNKAFRNEGKIIASPQLVVEYTGTTIKEAKIILDKLKEQKLLIPTGAPFEYVSPRMEKEWRIANETYDRYSKLGKKSADKNGIDNLNSE